MERKNIIRNHTILSVLLGVIVLGFLGYRYLAPFGKTVYYRFASKLPGADEVTTFSPGKDSILRIPSQIIRTEQSKLSLKLLSKEIESIKTTLKFKKGPKEIKLGVRGNEKDNFLYKPLYHSFLQNLNWGKIEEGDFILWQREKNYQTLSNFVNKPPEDKKAASFFVDQNKLQILRPIESGEGKTVIETPLRASHTLLVRVDKRPLVIKITKQDMNAYEGEDKFKITVLRGEKKLAEKTIEDDGIIDKSGLLGELKEEVITIEDVEQGIYQVGINYEGRGYDSLIAKIEINQQKVVFKDNLFILGNKPTTLWTNIPKISISTSHEQGLQTVKLNGEKELKITEVGKPFVFDLEALIGGEKTSPLYKLESPRNDLVLTGSGYFAFSQNSFFEPGLLKLIDLDTLSSLEGIDYILTTCPKAKQEGDWLVAETSFDPKDIKIEDDKLYFSLEAPELAKYGGELEIDYLEIAVKHKGALEKEEEEETQVETEKVAEQKQNILQRTLGSIANIFNRIGTFFANTIFKVFRREAKPSEEKPISTPTLSPSPSPTPTPEVEKISTLVKVLNGGAGKGEAGKFAEVLKKAGFSSVEPGNADKENYKNATIRFRSTDKSAVEKISELLSPDYKTIEKTEIATTSAEIIVILGSK